MFPGTALKPKHHYMRHYPDLCFEYGPLSHLSTLRFEGKHSYFERIILGSQNFKNITKTVSKKHEMRQVYCQAGNLFLNDLEENYPVPFVETMYSETLIQAVRGCGIDMSCAEESHKLSYRGTVYETESILFLDHMGKCWQKKLFAGLQKRTNHSLLSRNANTKSGKIWDLKSLNIAAGASLVHITKNYLTLLCYTLTHAFQREY